MGDALVIGLGNPILSDDGVGWRVAQYVREALVADHELAPPGGVEVREAALGGLALAELLVGFRRAVIVDAVVTRQAAPGAVSCLTLSDLPGTLNTASAHDTNLLTALTALRRCGAALPPPEAIYVVGVEAQDVLTFGERCTPPVEAAIAAAAEAVLAALRG